MSIILHNARSNPPISKIEQLSCNQDSRSGSALNEGVNSKDTTVTITGQPLKIVHLGKFFHPAHGGIETAVRSLAQSQIALGSHVRVICMDHDRGRPSSLDQDGPVEVLRLRRSVSFSKIDHCPDLASAIRDCEADLFHLHTPNPTMILGFLRSGDRRPLIISHYSDVVKQRARHWLFSPFERACYDRARLILSVSPPYINGSSVLRRYKSRVAVLPIGLELAPYLNPSPEILQRSEELKRSIPGPIWFSCGRLVYYKGFETGITALASVPGTLLIAGHGPLRSRLERLARRLKIEHRIRFLGKVQRDEELITYYLAAHAFWFPSNARSEAYGLVQVEAMASGCPVINTAIPNSGVPWVSRHDESGLTVPVGDSAAFAAAAQRLIDETCLRERLAAGARTRAVAEFDQETMGQRSMTLYSDILSSTRRDHSGCKPIGSR